MKQITAVVVGAGNRGLIYANYASDHKDGVVDVSLDVLNCGHSGGDVALMRDVCAYLNGDKSSISITDINDSVNGHLLVYAANESQKQNKTVKL